MKKLYLKYKDIFLYLVFGVLSTIVCILCYDLLVLTVLDPNNPVQLQIANIISWFVTIIFVYYTNRKYVFASTETNKIKEFSKFLVARVITLIIDMIIMGVGVSIIHGNDKIIKIISQVVVISSNYVFSKLFIFKKKV